MHAFKSTLVGLVMASFAASASAKCTASAQLDTHTSNLIVFDENRNKLGDLGSGPSGGSLSCLKPGGVSKVGADKTHLDYDVVMHVWCDTSTIESCSLDYGDYHSDKKDATPPSCEIEFDC